MIKTAQRSVTRAAIFATPFVLAACAVGPDYHRPALAPSASYGVAAAPRTKAPPATDEVLQPELSIGGDIPARWWEIFHSDSLDDLVALALKNNPTVAAADAALRAAQEQLKAQRGAYYPSITASIQPSREYPAPILANPIAAAPSLYNLTTTQVSVAYTPDFFGANARAVETLVAQEDQQRFELEAARLTLATNVVQAAIQDALLRAQVQDAQAIILDQQRTLSIFGRLKQLGQASKSDVSAQAALLAQEETTLPPLEKQFQINRDLLSALVGRTPGEPNDAQFELGTLSLPDRLPLSLPAELVEHRPDVRIAEAQLHAASAQVGVAAAARWPNLEIDASAGSAALSLMPSFNGLANFWGIAATLTQPIFEGGMLLHHEKAAEAAYDEAAAQYQGTVVGAFQNTADVLHALQTDGDALRAAEASEAASHTSLDIARKQLGLGDTSQLAVLAAEQAEDQARATRLQAQANHYCDVVALFQALGGGWWNRADIPGGVARPPAL